MLDNVQKHNNCINIQSSQTFRSYLENLKKICNITCTDKRNKLRGFNPQVNYTDRPTDRPSDRRLLAKFVLTLADSGCRVVSATNPHGR
jgi:hypothetical protein